MIEYAELHCHHQYSVLDGASTADEYCKRAKEVGIESLAITDHSTLAGHREHLDACIEHDIKCILGVELHVSVGSRFDKIAKSKRDEGEDNENYYHLVALAKNNNGLKNLNEMERLAWTEGFYGKPQVDMELLDKYGDDIIITSACVSGPIARNLIKEDEDRAMEWFNNLHGRFKEDFYVEVQDHNEGIAPGVNKKLIDIADNNGVKIVATRDCHHAHPKQLWLQEAVLILSTKPKKNPTIQDEKKRAGTFLDVYNHIYPDRKMTFEKAEVCLMSADYTNKKFLEQGIERPDMFSNTIEIAEKIG